MIVTALAVTLKRKESPVVYASSCKRWKREDVVVVVDEEEEESKWGEEKQQVQVVQEEDVILSIGDAIEKIASLNDSFEVVDKDDVLRLFRSQHKASFQFRHYLQRLVKYLHIYHGGSTPPPPPPVVNIGNNKNSNYYDDIGLRSIIMALVYLDRIHNLYPKARLSQFTLHRLMLVGMLVACKFTEDRSISNRYWARVCGLELSELNNLELAFCSLLQFNFYIGSETFGEALDSLANRK